MNLKQMVGIEAAKYVKDGMIVGLGTGSTAYYMVEEIGRRVKEEGLTITGVTTSKATQEQAIALGIPLKSIDQVPYVDLTIDGADEVDSQFSGIKGGGAALLFEKIVAVNSKKCIWIVDESKVVDTLGAFPLPVEVIPYGHLRVLDRFTEKGYQPKLRTNEDGTVLVTDGGHNIIDLYLEKIADPEQLAKELDGTVGVVEHGLFIGLTSEVIVGSPEGPKLLKKK